jgi:hypothetical protein
VIVFGFVRILYHDREKKSWFLDRLLAKHGDPSWVFEPGYPLLDQIILFEQKIESSRANTALDYVTDGFLLPAAR